MFSLTQTNICSESGRLGRRVLTAAWFFHFFSVSTLFSSLLKHSSFVVWLWFFILFIYTMLLTLDVLWLRRKKCIRVAKEMRHTARGEEEDAEIRLHTLAWYVHRRCVAVFFTRAKDQANLTTDKFSWVKTSGCDVECTKNLYLIEFQMRWTLGQRNSSIKMKFPMNPIPMFFGEWRSGKDYLC